MEQQKPLGEKNKQGLNPKPGKDNLGPNKPPKDNSQKLPVHPGERSDEESIGRPVQLENDPQKPRVPGEGEGHRGGIRPQT